MKIPQWMIDLWQAISGSSMTRKWEEEIDEAIRESNREKDEKVNRLRKALEPKLGKEAADAISDIIRYKL